MGVDVYEEVCLLTKIDDKLGDLEPGDPLLPPNSDASSALKVVPVHDDVDEQIESDRYPGNWSQSD